MVKKPKRPTRAAEIKEQLEEIVGHKIDVSEQQLAQFAYPVGTYALTELNHLTDCIATWNRIVAPDKIWTFCSLIDATGVSSTLADGKRVFLLSDLMRVGESVGFQEPINVVATPRAERPLFLTATYSLVPQGADPNISPDVQITVFSWDPNGVPAPNVDFDWRCRATLIPAVSR
jgi:hypothetical protein